MKHLAALPFQKLETERFGVLFYGPLLFAQQTESANLGCSRLWKKIEKFVFVWILIFDTGARDKAGVLEKSSE